MALVFKYVDDINKYLNRYEGKQIGNFAILRISLLYYLSTVR